MPKGNNRSRSVFSTKRLARPLLRLVLACFALAWPSCAVKAHAGALHLWRCFQKIDHLARSAPPYCVMAHGVQSISESEVSAALKQIRSNVQMTLLGTHFRIPFRVQSLYFYPVAPPGQAARGTWKFGWAEKGGKTYTKSIPVGPRGAWHKLHWPFAPPGFRRPYQAPPRGVFMPKGTSPPPGAFSVYMGAQSPGMARVRGWVPGAARRFWVKWSGGNHALRTRQVNVSYFNPLDNRFGDPPTTRCETEWPSVATMWPPDRIVICESFWGFPAVRFGAQETVSRSLISAGFPPLEAKQDLANAARLLGKLTPEESFLLQIVGLTPPPLLGARKEVRRTAMLIGQYQFYGQFYRHTRFTAVATRAGGKDVYVVAGYRKLPATGNRGVEYYLCFTKSGRLWCVGHQSWETGQRSPAQLAAMAVNLSGLSRSLLPSPRGKKWHR